MKINKIHINNILSYYNETIEFNNDLNIIVGANGSGKSNLMNIIIYLIKRYCYRNYEISNIYGPDRGDIKCYSIRQKNPLYNLSEDYFLQKHINKEKEYSSIELSITFEENDIRNLNEIKNLKDKICDFLDKYVQNVDFLEDKYQIDKNQVKQIFEVKDEDLCVNTELVLKICEEENDFRIKKEEKYYNYMKFFSLIVEILNLNNVKHNITNPFVFFEAYRNNSSETTKVGITEFNNNQGYVNLQSWPNLLALNNSIGINSSYITLATKKYGKLMRYVTENEQGNGLKDFYKNEEYVRLEKFFELFEYNIKLKCTSPENNIYQFFLLKDRVEIGIDSISSGEREIINFIFGLFLEELNDGIVIIDEPELHLHPNWQKKLIHILKEKIEDKNIQIFFVTHSSSFISYNILNNIYRIYKDNSFSRCVKINDLLHESNDSFRKNLCVINATNNEKIFFANSVILVEGITDEILFKKIYEAELGKIPDGVEFVNINGKRNLNNFKNVLDKLKIRYFYIGDYDNLYEYEEMQQFFCVNKKAQKKDLKEKNMSYSGLDLLKSIEELINENNDYNFKKLKINYDLYNKRFLKNRIDITDEDKRIINNFIIKKYEENIYILKRGEIENYIGTGTSNKSIGFNKVISFLNDNEKYNEFRNMEEFIELKEILQDIDSKIQNHSNISE